MVTLIGRILLTDADVNVEHAMNFYGTYDRGGGANLPINYQLTKINDTCNSRCIGQLVHQWLVGMSPESTADWLVSLSVCLLVIMFVCLPLSSKLPFTA